MTADELDRLRDAVARVRGAHRLLLAAQQSGVLHPLVLDGVVTLLGRAGVGLAVVVEHGEAETSGLGPIGVRR